MKRFLGHISLASLVFLFVLLVACGHDKSSTPKEDVLPEYENMQELNAHKCGISSFGQKAYVKNKGKVIPDKELPFLFNSFYRGSNSEGIPGSGIGLFECYEITRKLCGDIYARSDAENSETEFAVYLPGATHT